MSHLTFSGPTAKEIQDALVFAFPTTNHLAQMVNFVLGKPLQNMVNVHADLPSVVYPLCIQAEASGRLDDLICGAHAESPGNPPLAALHAKFFGRNLPGGAPELGAARRPLRVFPGTTCTSDAFSPTSWSS